VEGLGRVTARAAHVVHGQSVFLVAGLAPQQIYQRLEPPSSRRSIRSSDDARRRRSHPSKPDRALQPPREGDTWQSIAEHQGAGVVKATTLAIMNGHAVSDQPRQGEPVKIVVAG